MLRFSFLTGSIDFLSLRARSDKRAVFFFRDSNQTSHFMKKNRLLLLFLLMAAGMAASSQTVQRNMVVLEIATGTWCTYCPGASNAADQLITEGKNVAVIENHNGDTYANNYSNNRNSYYAVTGYPTGNFDGTASSVGGAACPNGNVYNSYLTLYNQQYAIGSPIAICLSGSNTGNNYTVNVSVTKLSSFIGNDVRLHLVLTESHIPVSWQGCMTEVNFVNRLMVPSENGTSVSFASGNTQVYTLNFTKDAAWNAAECEVVAFVQDKNTKEVFNGVKYPLNSMPGSLFTLNDFTAATTSGCAPLTVNFSTTQSSGVTYTWNFEAGSPSSSTASNPAVTYTTSGTYDVSITGTDGMCYDTRTKPDYITALAAPVAPQTPTGTTGLCQNPATLMYTTAAVPYAESYTWDLSPAAAGSLSANGNSVMIDWDNTWTGTALLKVKGNNSCGTGNWSTPLSINVDAIPGQCPAPIGPTSLCANPAVTQYSTVGIVPSTYYNWELTPAEAGTFFQGSSVIDIDWADTFSGTATLRVKANNASCEGTFSDPISITVNPLPAAFTVGGGGTYCGPSGTGLPVTLAGSESATSYTLYKDGTATTTILQGTGNGISFGNQTGAGTYSVHAASTAGCASVMTGTASLSIDPQAPVKPADPAGPAVVVTTQNPTSDFTSQSQYAATYAWSLTPAEAGIMAGNGATGTITWNQSYIGTSTIRVQGVNTCGSSVYSNEVSTSVNIGVGLNENTAASGITLSPNPAGDYAVIHTNHEFKGSISLMSTSGKRVENYPDVAFASEFRMDLSGLASGIYTVLITEGTNRSTLKLVIR
jgi:PKD repeat protein